MMHAHDAILTAFHAHRDTTLVALRDAVHHALSPLLGDAEPKLHHLDARIKTTESLRGKLARPDKSYARLTDITDLLGVRVITYFDDGVRAVARHIEATLDVDLNNSISKGAHDAPDRFGYRSLHYVCRPPDGFHVPPDLEGLRFEIQVRTILQHAWAEIEHDIGYKSPTALPPRIRRRFSQLAGVLELADDTFLTIKRELADHRDAVTRQVQSGASSVPLDRSALDAFLHTPACADLDADVARTLGVPLDSASFFPDYLVRMLDLAGLRDLATLRDALGAYRDPLSDFVHAYFRFTTRAFGLTPDDVPTVQRGYGLLFIAHMRLVHDASLKIDRLPRVADFFFALDRLHSHDEARRVAACFLEELPPPQA